MEMRAFNEQSLLLENAELRARLEEAEELLRAIRAGEVDAIMVEADAGPRLFTLQGLDAQQNRFRGDMLAQVSDAVIAVDLDDRVTFLNAAAEQQYRVKASDMLGRKLDEIVSRHWPTPAEEAASRAALRDFGTWRGEELQHTHDGRELAVESTISKLHAPDGSCIGMVAAVRDITERLRINQELREREHFLERIFDVMPGILKIVDMKDSRCVFVNQNVNSVLGFSPDEIVHMGADIVKILMHLDDQAYYHQHFVRLSTFEPGTIAKFEYRMLHKDGEWRWLETRDTVFLRDANGVAIQYIGLSSEITERKRAEEELRRLAAELSSADQRKDEFLATLAHELRNPLAPIRNGLQILRLSGDDKETVEEIRTMMERQLAQMVHLVDDLLDVSRISRGKLELRKQRIELSSIVNNAVETSRPLIDASGHELTIIVPSESILVDADATRLGQVFSNILNNAAKYSEHGSRIRLAVDCQDSDVVVSIKDTGMGIPPDMLPKIFEMFTQVDRSLEKAQGGLGIGLSLVKRLVEMHGGSVVANSEGHGAGSEFVIRLPIALAMDQDSKLSIDEERPTNLPGQRRILVADDNQDAANTLAMILRIMGNEVRTVYDGLQAVQVAAVFQPDVIMLDIGMPMLNGYEACHRIREQPWSEKVVLIALTGWGQDEDKRRSQKAGFNHHMVKPVDPAALRKLLSVEQTAR